MLGRPFGEGYMSANIAAGNNTSRCSARNANTLPAGISSRQVSHTSGPTGSPTHSPCITTSLPRRHSRRSQDPNIFSALLDAVAGSGTIVRRGRRHRAGTGRLSGVGPADLRQCHQPPADRGVPGPWPGWTSAPPCADRRVWRCTRAAPACATAPNKPVHASRPGQTDRKPSHVYPTTSGIRPLPVASGCMGRNESGTPKRP